MIEMVVLSSHHWEESGYLTDCAFAAVSPQVCFALSHCLIQSESVHVSIVVNFSACHAEDQCLIPRRGALLFLGAA